MSPPSVKPNPAKDARRQQLIEATIDCIYQIGLDQTTVAKVTAQAGLSVGTVNFHFGNKQELLLGTLAHVCTEFTERLNHIIAIDKSPADTLTQFVDLHFDPEICSPQKIAVWYVFSNASHSRTDYQVICGELDQKIRALLVQKMHALCTSRTEPTYDIEALARGLEGLLDGLWQEYLYSPETFDTKAATKTAYAYLSSLFPKAFQSDSQPSSAKKVDLLPPWTYLDPEFLQREQDQLFKANWMLVCHVSELAKPKDYVTFDGFGERALILRDKENVIRAFHNVCRHRGAKLVDGQGRCPEMLSCPFHGWSYDLKGNLVAVPARDTFESFSLSDNGLVSLPVEQWMGFIFIRFSQEGTSLKQQMAPVEHLIAPYQIEKMQLLPSTRHAESRPYNWKVIHDIDNEGYHVPVGHPSLQQLYGKSYQDTSIDGISFSSATINEKIGRLWSVKNYQKLLPSYLHLSSENQRVWQYISIFPNMVIGLYPESIEYYMTIPESVSSTRYLGASFGLPDSSRETRAARYLNRRINGITEHEDESFVLQMQQGKRSSALPDQKLSSRESGVRHFHHAIQAAIPEACFATKSNN